MRIVRWILITFGTLLLISGVVAWQPANIENDPTRSKLIRLKLEHASEDMKKIVALDLDVAGVDVVENTVDLVVNDADIKKLINIWPMYEWHFVDNASAQSGPDESYYNPEEVEAALKGFWNQYPHLTHLESIGKSIENRDIWAIKISDNPDEHELSEPVILFNAMHHAREVMTTEVAMDTIEYLLKHYGDDAQVRHWVNHNEIWVVPMLNVDGNNRVWTQYSYWRKNVRDELGVDINRNYPYKWNACQGSSGSPYSQTYRGPEPASEPETQALMNLVARIRPVFNISYHSYSELVLYPYGCPSEHTETQQLVEGIGKQLAQLLPRDNNPEQHYTAGTPWEILYAVDGDDISWMYHEHQVIPYVIELNASSQGFQPSYEQWRDPTVQKLRAAWGFLLNRLEQAGVRGVVHSPEGVVSYISYRRVQPSAGPEQRYQINPDGTFHIVLQPGEFLISFKLASGESIEQTVVVEDKLVRMDLKL